MVNPARTDQSAGDSAAWQFAPRGSVAAQAVAITPISSNRRVLKILFTWSPVRALQRKVEVAAA
jgi:hypothetical protein